MKTYTNAYGQPTTLLETRDKAYAIKVKHEEDKRWSFLTSTGGTTYLRIHASYTQDKAKAERLAEDIRTDNPDFGVKVVEFSR